MLGGSAEARATGAALPTRWHIAWDTLVAPADADYVFAKAAGPLFQLWGEGEAPRPSLGRATYATRLIRARSSFAQADGLFIPDTYSSYRLYANGVEIARNGEVGTGPEDNVPHWRQTLARLPPADTLELVLQVANYHHARGGVSRAWTLGAHEELAWERRKDDLYAAFVAALYFLGALVMLGTYRLYRENRAALYFAGVCLTVLYRTIGAGSYLLHDIYPGLPYALTLRVEYSSYYLTCWLYWELIHEIIGRRISRPIMTAQRLWHVTMLVLILVTPDYFFTGLIPLGHVVIVATAGYCGARLIAWARGHWRVRGLGFGAFLLIAVMSAVSILDNLALVPVPRQVIPVLIAGQIMLFYLYLNGEARDHLRHMQRAAVAASAAKSDFLATMSHEIRTPMNGVLGMTSLLGDTPLSTEQRQYVDTIRMSGQNLITIINDILDFSKADAGKMSLEVQAVCLSEVLRDTAALIDGNVRQKGLELHVELPRELRDIRVETDPTRLSQIVTNLLSNAVKFTDAGTVRLRLRGRATDADFRAEIDIEDTGIGMDETQVAQLFESFHQADASITRRYGGTGLGLAISKRLAELLGGRIAVRSTPGAGTTFTLSLPMKRLPDRADPGEELTAAALPGENTGVSTGGGAFAKTSTLAGSTAEASAQTGTPPTDAPLPPLRILVAEDHPVNQRLIATILRKRGYEPDLVGNGLEAIEAIDRQPYDLIFMDMQMPECGGLQATREIRKRHSPGEVAIVALTANAQVSDRAACANAGMQEFIAKPFRVDEIEAVLRTSGASLAKPPSAGETPTSAAPAAALAVGTVGDSGDAPTPAAVSPSPAPPEDSPEFPPLRILVAEDHPVNQKLIERVLAKWGYEPVLVGDGRQAVEAVGERSFDLVFMDLQMPVCDGISATREIRQRYSPSELAIVALTANTGAADRAACLAAGMQDFIAKPFRPKDISAVLMARGAATEASPVPVEA